MPDWNKIGHHVTGTGRIAEAPGRRYRTWAAIASVTAAAVILVGVLVQRRFRDNFDITQAAMYRTYPGQRDSVLFLDGTRVILGPSSYILVSGRQIRMLGDAHFIIRHHEGQPYTIRARGVTVRDIGTEFSVRLRTGEPLQVTVTNGVVEMARLWKKIRLDSGDLGVFADGKLTRQADVVTEDDLAWRHGRLVFRDAPFSRVAADLQRWYGVILHVVPGDSALLARRFTGTFASEPANQVLDVLARALGASIERRGDTAHVRSTVR